MVANPLEPLLRKGLRPHSLHNVIDAHWENSALTLTQVGSLTPRRTRPKT